MKNQWQVIVGIILAILIAVFAIINVESVEVNFFFAKLEWPLILVILGSVLIGGLIIFCLNIAKVRGMNKQVKQLHEEKTNLERQLAAAKAMQTKTSTISIRDTEETEVADAKVENQDEQN
ncbi:MULTISPECIES: lipopolysaccharide assembly LapA domain-containing protein [Listeria]|uniref:LapA family protein n=1 Tax=Listeria TaxID=1637 RepID=UPI000B58C048|nr:MULTISPECIES: lipopolysaccharide assembly LapA domain-containing protein [Listeria]